MKNIKSINLLFNNRIIKPLSLTAFVLLTVFPVSAEDKVTKKDATQLIFKSENVYGKEFVAGYLNDKPFNGKVVYKAASDYYWVNTYGSGKTIQRVSYFVDHETGEHRISQKDENAYGKKFTAFYANDKVDKGQIVARAASDFYWVTTYKSGNITHRINYFIDHETGEHKVFPLDKIKM